METYTKSRITQMLENYRNDTQTITILRRSLNEAPRISEDQIINDMNFQHGESIGMVTGHISDKTAYIAQHYRQKLNDVNQDSLNQYAADLWRMEQERETLNFYVSLLEPRQRQLISLYYMQDVPRERIAAEMDITVRTFHYIRKRAIERLAAMYNLTEKLRG